MAWATEPGLFGGIDLHAGAVSGTSHDVDAGMPAVGGGIVHDVRFGTATGIGGHLGYRFRGSLSAFVSYRHVEGTVGWDTTFPLFASSTRFGGSAISDAVLVNIGYDHPLSASTTLKATAGIGVTLNTLASVVETTADTGEFVSLLTDHSRFSPIAQLGLGVEHAIGRNGLLGLRAALSYDGGFKTGATRTGNLGVTAINPYRIEEIWRADLHASLRYRF